MTNIIVRSFEELKLQVKEFTDTKFVIKPQESVNIIVPITVEPEGDFRLLEDGFNRLLEDGFKRLLE